LLDRVVEHKLNGTKIYVYNVHQTALATLKKMEKWYGEMEHRRFVQFDAV
jgi:hypothetical protein